jgi:hypothetical protein
MHKVNPQETQAEESKDKYIKSRFKIFHHKETSSQKKGVILCK